jgi:hypothetical protein
MAEKSQHQSHRDTVDRIRNADSFAVNLPVFGRVRIPRPEHVAYYGALGALAALEIIEWPIALAIAAGHALAQNQRNHVAQEIGEALEEV